MANALPSLQARGFQPLPAGEANQAVIRPPRTEPPFRLPVPPRTAEAPREGPAAGRVARPLAGRAIFAAPATQVPQRLADLLRQETGRARMAATTPVAAPAKAVVTTAPGGAALPATATEEGPAAQTIAAQTLAAQAPATAGNAGGIARTPTFAVEPATPEVAFNAAPERAGIFPAAALGNRIRQAGAVQELLLAATAAPQPPEQGGVGMPRTPRVMIDQKV